jgi:uncharacterized protein YbjT (DUF2867 family)
VSRYLVIGGTGRTGRLVVDRLTGHGNHVTVASRRPGPAPRPAVDTISLDVASAGPGLSIDHFDGIVVCVEPPADPAGADAVAHRGVGAIAALAAERQARIVLVSQIYITRADAHHGMAAIIDARRRGEEALRVSGAPYAIVRPGWLTDRPAGGAWLEQGDTGDGHTSRHTLAEALAAALSEPAALGTTFELYDDPGHPARAWEELFARLRPDTRQAADAR